MSKRNNVHPDHYKLAGRDRPGDAMPKPPKQHPRKSKSGKKDAASFAPTSRLLKKPAT